MELTPPKLESALTCNSGAAQFFFHHNYAYRYMYAHVLLHFCAFPVIDFELDTKGLYYGSFTSCQLHVHVYTV